MIVKVNDFRFSNTVRATFRCDGGSITVQIMRANVAAGPPRTFTHEEAVELGNRIVESGSWDEFPVEIPVDALKSFGHRLRQYGLHGD